MNPRLKLLGLGAAAGALAWWWQNRDRDGEGLKDWIPGTGNAGGGELMEIGFGVTMTKWIDDLKTRGAKYQPLFKASEGLYRLPAGLLARVAWQESRYREDIITGKIKSRAGAAGIMQFMPATAKGFGIDPLVPSQAIDAAGKYLANLYKTFGTWELALRAYNFGQGNVRKWLHGLKTLPEETRRYSDEILTDLGMKK